VFASDNGSNIDISSDTIDSSSTNSQNIPLLKSFLSADSSFLSDQTNVSIDGDALSSDGVSSLGNTVVGPDSDSSEDGASLYVVNSGDTISSIAKMFDISDATLISTNELKKGQKLSPGEVLFIMPVDGVQAIIRKGDTLQGLAKKYSTDIKDIYRFNGLTDETQLAVGDSVFIPNGTLIITPLKKSFSQTKSIKSLNISKSKKSIYASLPNIDEYFMNPIPGARRSQGIHDVGTFSGLSGGAIDLAINTGTPIKATADGVVVVSNYTSGRCRSSCFGGFGNFVVIKHSNNTFSLYAHMSRVLASVGDQVKQGDKIGLVGSTGRSTGPHLHFVIYGAQNPLD